MSTAISFSSPNRSLKSDNPSSCFAFSNCYSQKVSQLENLKKNKSQANKYKPQLSEGHWQVQEVVFVELTFPWVQKSVPTSPSPPTGHPFWLHYLHFPILKMIILLFFQRKETIYIISRGNKEHISNGQKRKQINLLWWQGHLLGESSLASKS